MKYLLIFSLLLAGCGSTVESRNSEERFNGQSIKIVTFDGCEYVRFEAGSGAWGAHMGNCKNPIHKR